MLKLLITLACSILIAVALLQLRHQRLELSYQTNHLHEQIRRSQAKLWDQQLQIAVYTAPNAISKTVGDQKLNMVPQTPIAATKTDWTEPETESAAE